MGVWRGRGGGADGFRRRRGGGAGLVRGGGRWGFRGWRGRRRAPAVPLSGGGTPGYGT